MALAKRQVDVAIAFDSGLDHLRVSDAFSEFFVENTIIGSANGTAGVSKANSTGIRHVLRQLGVSIENTIASAKVVISGLPDTMPNQFFHAGGGVVNFGQGILCAANTTVSASLVSAGASVNTSVWIAGISVRA